MPTKAHFHCDGSDCDRNAGAFDGRQALPPGFLRVDWGNQPRDEQLVFCSWDCAIKYGAKLPPTETISWDSLPEPTEGTHDV